MTEPMAPKIVVVEARSEEFDGVLGLWRSHSSTLGFFPRGAFEERARMGQLLGAIEQGGLRGFLTFRTSREVASILHLCVDDEARGGGLAKRLVEELAARVSGTCSSIRLKCRRDYPAAAIWPRLGFQPLLEKAGRAEGGSELGVWVRELSAASAQGRLALTSPSRVQIAVDTNLFLDLVWEDRPGHEQASALLADWASTELEVVVTPELFLELDRNKDGPRRETSKKRANAFSRVAGTQAEFCSALGRLDAALGDPTDAVRDQSDRHHVAYAASAGVTVFATHDANLRKCGPKILDGLGIRVLAPEDVVMRLEELQDEARYRPARLSGTTLSSGHVTADQVGAISRRLSSFPPAKPVRVFSSELKGFLADRKRFEGVAIWKDGEPLTLRITERAGDVLRLLDLRAVRDLGPTLRRRVLAELIQTEAQRGSRAILAAPETVAVDPEAFDRLGFVGFEGGSVRLLHCGGLTCEQARPWLREVATSIPEARAAAELLLADLEAAIGSGSPELHARLERSLWPARLVDAPIPSFVVPILPRWAALLFDEGLAARELFSASPLPGLRLENAYYRSVKNDGGMRTPSRILWYVSGGRTKHQKVMEVRACSTLDRVLTGPADRMFHLHERLGVYSEADVRRARGGDPTGKVMALRFSDTAALASPVRRKALLRMLAPSARDKHPLASPLRLAPAEFEAIFSAGSPK